MNYTHAPIYNSDAKAQWRAHIYDVLSNNNCHTLLDASGNFKYKWLEAIGEDALPFKQILATERIRESQLIGIDLDPDNPERSLLNIERCKGLFPQAEFYCEDWINDCKDNYAHENIGYIITDIYVATAGDNFERTVQASIHLAEKSKRALGEVLFVLNCDLTQAKRFQRGTKESFAQETERIFRTSSRIPEFKKIKIHPESVYTYKNPGRRDEMATLIIIL